MAKKRLEKRPRGSIWKRGNRLARGYYIEMKSGVRAFRLKETKHGHKIHKYEAPITARGAGWRIFQTR